MKLQKEAKILEWLLKEIEYDKDKIELNGNKYIIGNGYMGYRGTLEEFSKKQLVACNLSGVYDKVEDKWREPVNAPNGIYTKLYCNGEPLSVLESKIGFHEQSLDIKNAVHKRTTQFITSEGICVEVKSERFLSLHNVHLMCMKYEFKASEACTIVLESGIDGDVWDINGPHLKEMSTYIQKENLVLASVTNEDSCSVSVVEFAEKSSGNETIITKSDSIIRQINYKVERGQTYYIKKYISVFTGKDEISDCSAAAVESNSRAALLGYDEMLSINMELWKKRWIDADIIIQGDDCAQLALRYSIYHLLIIAPEHNDRVSIPARGLSGQVYKGAIFWDTEIFMLPFFTFVCPDIARNLLKYRFHTLEGARRKAKQYGYRGAFYAWESQENGDDACTNFNVTDVFTGRPMRTYFRDKQVHISADIAYAIWKYYSTTGDESLLIEGGAEVVIECARFFYSYAYFNMDKDRYEILDVTGPDEYHERVNNNAYTNIMIKHALEAALKVIAFLKENNYSAYNELEEKICFERDLDNLKYFNEKLYIPKPQNKTNIIEQFDRYSTLEDISVEKLKERILNPNEYWGGGNGLATTTKIIKQADVVLALNLFKEEFTEDIKKANWEYYEPFTEHGSSLSACVYALLAADLGKIDWAYKYFMKTATIDITGESKQYVGTLYIGGTHPASNGGAWMSVVLGFGGVSISEGYISIKPKLPKHWDSLKFSITYKKDKYYIEITKDIIDITCDNNNKNCGNFTIDGKTVSCEHGKHLKLSYT